MKKILIAEDDALLAKIYTNIFASSRFETRVASDGKVAMDFLDLEYPPDVVLLDLDLPVVDGIGVLKHIRSIDRLRGIPVMIVSNLRYFDGSGVANRGGGATHFAHKGDCSPEDLTSEALALIDARREQLARMEKDEALPFVPSAVPSNQALAAPLAAHTQQAVQRVRADPRLRILLADDDPTIHRLLTYFFKEEGFEVFSAFNGLEVVRLAEKERPDLILLDEMMPGLDGIEVLIRLRDDSWLDLPPVIMLSGKKCEELEREAIRHGARMFMRKPVTPQRLILSIKEICRVGSR